MIDLEALKQSALKSLENPGGGAPLPKTTKKNSPTLYIFRHCQTFDNIRKIFSGRRQTRLTDKGKSQAEKIAELLKKEKIDLFLSPPQLRCEQTLAPVRKLFPKVPYEQLQNMIERDYGILTGTSKMSAMKKWPEKAILWRRSWDIAPPKGECLKDVWEQRVKPFCEQLEARMKKEQISVAYCGTNNTVRLIRWYFEKMPKEEMLTLESPYGDYASYSV